MTNFQLLDKMAAQVTDLLETDEKESFGGDRLDDMTSATVSLRMDISEVMIDRPSPATNPRFLFEDIGLDDALEHFSSDWGDDINSLMVRPPLLMTIDNARTWQDRPEVRTVFSRFAGLRIGLSGRKSHIVRNGQDYIFVLFRPQYPEWYVYTRGPHAMADEERISLLSNIQEDISELMVPDNRLDKEEVEHFYALFLREIIPGFMQAAQGNESVMKAFTTWYGLYSVCGIEFVPDNLMRLPSFYKEWAMLFVESLRSEKFIHALQGQVRASA